MEQLEMKIPPTWERKEVDISKIIIEEELDAAAVAHTYKSVSNLGMIFQEVVLVIEGAFFRIVAGRRRVQSAKKAGMETVPALVLQQATPEGVLATITAVENMSRRPNPAVEAESLDVMMAAYKMSEQNIADKFGIPVSHIKAAMKLFKLIPEFFVQLKAGKISLSTARVLTNLSKDRQLELLAEEKLTLKKVSGTLRSQKLDDLIPAELFKIPERPVEDTVDVLIGEALQKLQKAAAITTNGRKATLEKVIQLLGKE